MLLLLFRKGIDILLESGTLLINREYLSADLDENPFLKYGLFWQNQQLICYSEKTACGAFNQIMIIRDYRTVK